MVGETEAVPLCHLDEGDRGGADVFEDFSRHEVADVHRQEVDLTEHRRANRPKAPQCEGCDLVGHCPTTWAMYLALFGTDELRPVRATAAP